MIPLRARSEAALEQRCAPPARSSTSLPLKAFERLSALQGKNTISAAEAYWWHRDMINREEARYDVEICGGAFVLAEKR